MPLPEEKLGLDGLKVVFFETRLATEMGDLIRKKGGEPVNAPCLREVPLEENRDALAFGERLLAGSVDILILLTGVGTRLLLKILETAYPRPRITARLNSMLLVARGPKPAKVLRDQGFKEALSVPEPNTWKDLLKALDEGLPVKGKNVAVQEYGMPNSELLEGLRARGAHVERVPVYQWALPEDLRPLKRAINLILEGKIQVILFTNATQAKHLMQVARLEKKEEALVQACRRVVVGSVGPLASEAIRNFGLTVDLEPDHPKFGALIQLASREAKGVLKAKPGI